MQRLETIVFAIGSYGSNAWRSSNPNSGVYVTDIAKTIDSIQCGNPSCHQGGIAIVEISDMGVNNNVD